MVVAIDSPVGSWSELLEVKQKNIREFEFKARELVAFYMRTKKIYTVFRIAKELQELYCDVEDIEDFIVETGDPYYIFKFAREIRSSNIPKMQKAIIKTQKFNFIAKFACFVSGADTALLENIIIESGNAHAAYIYLKFGKHPDIQRLKHIFFKSKKPRYLYTLAHSTNDSNDLELIQELIIGSKSDMYVRLFATHIPGANIRKLEDRILKTKNFDEIQKFARSVKSDRLNKLIVLI